MHMLLVNWPVNCFHQEGTIREITAPLRHRFTFSSHVIYTTVSGSILRSTFGSSCLINTWSTLQHKAATFGYLRGIETIPR
jgi:hypothetical protein